MPQACAVGMHMHKSHAWAIARRSHSCAVKRVWYGSVSASPALYNGVPAGCEERDSKTRAGPHQEPYP